MSEVDPGPGQKLFIDTERVIAAVAVNPGIWNPFDEHYKNKKKRANAWTVVCHEVLDHFEQYENEDQRELEKRVQQRWRTARDCYVKARTRPPGAPDTAYVFMEQLAFLEPTLRQPRPLPSTRASHAGDASDPQPTTNKPHVKRSVKHLIPTRLKNLLPSKSSNEADDMTDFERQLLAILKKMESPLEEDDENFFRSLAPMLRAFDSHHKLVFRSRVLATALDVQTQCGSVYLEAPFLNHDVDLQEDEPVEKKYRPPDADSSNSDTS